jgi:hypothetical protein
MKYRISKSRFNEIVKKLLMFIIGDITFKKSLSSDVIELHNKYGNNFADIWKNISGATKKKCKKTITFYLDVSEMIENFIPIVRKKEFSKAIIDYVYNQTGIKCDCVEFMHSINYVYDDDGNSRVDRKLYHYRKK